MLQTKSYHDQTRWARFLLCASRVHCIGTADFTGRASLNHRSLHLQRGEHELVRVLVEHNSGETFLPSLQILYWVPAVDGNDETLLSTLLCSRSLVRLYLQQPDIKFGQPAPLALKSDVHLQGAPLLRVLVIKWDVQYVDIPVTRWLSNFKWLRHVELECEQLDPSDFERLGNSQSLEYIRCKITGFADCRRKIKLSSTKTLRVVGHFESISGFVTSVEAPLLTEFLAGIGVPSTVPMLQCVQCIRSSSLSANLHTLHLYTYNCHGVIIKLGNPVSLSSFLEPYYTLKTLRHLSIEGTVPTAAILMTDNDLNTIAQGFQRLRSLSISHTVFLPQSSLPPEWRADMHDIMNAMLLWRPGAGCAPITVLRHFALHCPHLIALSLDCVSISTEGGDLSLHSANWRSDVIGAGHLLRDLNLTRRSWKYYWDPSIDPLEVGEYLNTLFPELNTVTLRERVPAACISDKWGRVVDEIAARQRGRRASREKTAAM